MGKVEVKERKQANWEEPLIYEYHTPGRRGVDFPQLDSDLEQALEDALQSLPSSLLRDELPRLPEVSEIDVIRHYTRLSQMNYGVDSGIYPLGSCTMKHNPKLNEEVAALLEASDIHPYQNIDTVQGALRIMYELEQWLKELSGMDAVTLHPAAGAHGEFVGVLVIRAYHAKRGELGQRTEMIVPDSAHGTNPASAAMAGFEVIEIPSGDDGCVDLDALEAALSEKTAGLMLTNPNTLGLFEKDIKDIARMVHDAGGLLYYDGANLNPLLGRIRPGDMGFDVCHFNLHKSFSTPHGGGGPGAGPVGVKAFLDPFLPIPRVKKTDDRYYLDDDYPESIGKVRSYHASFAVLLRAYAYIYRMGLEGLKTSSELAVLNANYLYHHVRQIKGFEVIHAPERRRWHEFVVSARPMLKDTGVSALDVSKRLQDFGMHPPTIYFPLIVPEALMIEPTETESKQELDFFIAALKQISNEAYSEANAKLHQAPYNTSRRLVNDVLAARKPVLSRRMATDEEKK